MTTLTVGAGESFPTLSAAIAAAQDGDVIQVAAGTYVNDFATINTNITIEGIGGMVHLEATVPPPNGKAILEINANVTLYNVEFSGAAVADGNGAGIRYDGGNLVLDHCYFHDNQDGLLSASDLSGSITIRNSEFANNGTGDGLTHNLYVGEIGTLTITDSYFHDAVGGHEIKSRAHNNIIENNRIGEGPNGDGSFDIDLPNGGDATVQDNVIEKGPNAPNRIMISYGEEGGIYANSTLSVTGNTVLNDNPDGATLVHDLSGATVAITDNQIFGITASQLYSAAGSAFGAGSPSISGNAFLATEPPFDTSSPFLPVVPFVFAVCFACGTRILSASGPVAVELLRAGDQVVTLVDGARVLRPLTWIGHRRIDLTTHPRPEIVMPVRIVRGAIADNVPERDLLISPDHALFLDGVLIVARQLINGGTIRREEVLSAVSYFHLDLDAHGILLAEGLPAESYLDTGNRGFFANAAAPLVLHPDLSGRVSDFRLAGSCAPFRSDEATVRPIWQRLADRSATLGYGTEKRASTSNPGLFVWARGRPVPAVRVDRGRYVFVLPADTSEVRLLSRSSVPTECRPWLDDRRLLGVSVRGIVLRGADAVEEVPLDHPGLHYGWWAAERDGTTLSRWTDGDARLPLPRIHMPAVLEIHLSGQMIYPESEATMPMEVAALAG